MFICVYHSNSIKLIQTVETKLALSGMHKLIDHATVKASADWEKKHRTGMTEIHKTSQKPLKFVSAHIIQAWEESFYIINCYIIKN